MSFRISTGQISGSGARFLNPNSQNSPLVKPLYWISDWIELLLKKIAENKLGPTVTTRWLFLTTNIIYNSYQFITSNKSPIDEEYWSSKQKGILSVDSNYTQSFIEKTCQYFIPILINTYIKPLQPLTQDELNALVNKHKSILNINDKSFNALKILIDTYLSKRDNDGWKLTTTFDGILPNGSNNIEVSDSKVDQDLRNLPQPSKWTPLSFNGVRKGYMTPEWGTKNKGIINDVDFKELLDNTYELFPSDLQYENEMKEVDQITSNLTDEQKVEAEFWAGGPGTVTPPGMWIVFLDIVIRSNGLNYLKELKYYTILSSSLYQSSICAWKIKREKLQARPIQKIRQDEYGKDISQPWNSQTLGEYWLPFQELNFVTPPFPDFVSGHSTFSMSSAKIFCYLLETDSINLNIPVVTNDMVRLLSPIITKSVNFTLNNVFIFPDRSKVQNNIPSTSINLNWNSWTDMARSSGKSRIYGGIHIESSNQGGLYLGSMIADKMWNLFKDI
jgi:hypothetical protein